MHDFSPKENPADLNQGIRNVSHKKGFSVQGPHISRGPKNQPKIQRYSPKHRVYTNFLEKFGANFCLHPCDMSQEASRNCSEKLVQMKVFSFWVG